MPWPQDSCLTGTPELVAQLVIVASYSDFITPYPVEPAALETACVNTQQLMIENTGLQVSLLIWRQYFIFTVVDVGIDVADYPGYAETLKYLLVNELT